MLKAVPLALNCKLCTVSTINGLDYLELGSRIRNGSAVRRLHLGLWNPNYSDAAGSSTQRHSKKNNTNNNNANTKLNKIRNELSALCTLINDRMSITTRTHTHMPILSVLVCMCICPPHVHSFTYTCIRSMYMYAEASESSYCNFTANSHNLRQYCEQLRIW